MIMLNLMNSAVFKLTFIFLCMNLFQAAIDPALLYNNQEVFNRVSEKYGIKKEQISTDDDCGDNCILIKDFKYRNLNEQDTPENQDKKINIQILHNELKLSFKDRNESGEIQAESINIDKAAFLCEYIDERIGFLNDEIVDSAKKQKQILDNCALIPPNQKEKMRNFVKEYDLETGSRESLVYFYYKEKIILIQGLEKQLDAIIKSAIFNHFYIEYDFMSDSFVYQNKVAKQIYMRAFYHGFKDKTKEYDAIISVKQNKIFIQYYQEDRNYQVNVPILVQQLELDCTFDFDRYKYVLLKDDKKEQKLKFFFNTDKGSQSNFTYEFFPGVVDSFNVQQYGGSSIYYQNSYLPTYEYLTQIINKCEKERDSDGNIISSYQPQNQIKNLKQSTDFFKIPVYNGIGQINFFASRPANYQQPNFPGKSFYFVEFYEDQKTIKRYVHQDFYKTQSEEEIQKAKDELKKKFILVYNDQPDPIQILERPIKDDEPNFEGKDKYEPQYDSDGHTIIAYKLKPLSSYDAQPSFQPHSVTYTQPNVYEHQVPAYDKKKNFLFGVKIPESGQPKFKNMEKFQAKNGADGKIEEYIQIAEEEGTILHQKIPVFGKNDNLEIVLDRLPDGSTPNFMFESLYVPEYDQDGKTIAFRYRSSEFVEIPEDEQSKADLTSENKEVVMDEKGNDKETEQNVIKKTSKKRFHRKTQVDSVRNYIGAPKILDIPIYGENGKLQAILDRPQNQVPPKLANSENYSVVRDMNKDIIKFQSHKLRVVVDDVIPIFFADGSLMSVVQRPKNNLELRFDGRKGFEVIYRPDGVIIHSYIQKISEFQRQIEVKQNVFRFTQKKTSFIELNLDKNLNKQRSHNKYKSKYHNSQKKIENTQQNTQTDPKGTVVFEYDDNSDQNALKEYQLENSDVTKVPIYSGFSLIRIQNQQIQRMLQSQTQTPEEIKKAKAYDIQVQTISEQENSFDYFVFDKNQQTEFMNEVIMIQIPSLQIAENQDYLTLKQPFPKIPNNVTIVNERQLKNDDKKKDAQDNDYQFYKVFKYEYNQKSINDIIQMKIQNNKPFGESLNKQLENLQKKQETTKLEEFKNSLLIESSYSRKVLFVYKNKFNRMSDESNWESPYISFIVQGKKGFFQRHTDTDQEYTDLNFKDFRTKKDKYAMTGLFIQTFNADCPEENDICKKQQEMNQFAYSEVAKIYRIEKCSAKQLAVFQIEFQQRSETYYLCDNEYRILQLKNISQQIYFSTKNAGMSDGYYVKMKKIVGQQQQLANYNAKQLLDIVKSCGLSNLGSQKCLLKAYIADQDCFNYSKEQQDHLVEHRFCVTGYFKGDFEEVTRDKIKGTYLDLALEEFESFASNQEIKAKDELDLLIPQNMKYLFCYIKQVEAESSNKDHPQDHNQEVRFKLVNKQKTQLKRQIKDIKQSPEHLKQISIHLEMTDCEMVYEKKEYSDQAKEFAEQLTPIVEPFLDARKDFCEVKCYLYMQQKLIDALNLNQQNNYEAQIKSKKENFSSNFGQSFSKLIADQDLTMDDWEKINDDILENQCTNEIKFCQQQIWREQIDTQDVKECEFNICHSQDESVDKYKIYGLLDCDSATQPTEKKNIKECVAALQLEIDSKKIEDSINNLNNLHCIQSKCRQLSQLGFTSIEQECEYGAYQKQSRIQELVNFSNLQASSVEDIIQETVEENKSFCGDRQQDLITKHTDYTEALMIKFKTLEAINQEYCRSPTQEEKYDQSCRLIEMELESDQAKQVQRDKLYEKFEIDQNDLGLIFQMYEASIPDQLFKDEIYTEQEIEIDTALAIEDNKKLLKKEHENLGTKAIQNDEQHHEEPKDEEGHKNDQKLEDHKNHKDHKGQKEHKNHKDGEESEDSESSSSKQKEETKDLEKQVQKLRAHMKKSKALSKKRSATKENQNEFDYQGNLQLKFEKVEVTPPAPPMMGEYEGYVAFISHQQSIFSDMDKNTLSICNDFNKESECQKLVKEQQERKAKYHAAIANMLEFLPFHMNSDPFMSYMDHARNGEL